MDHQVVRSLLPLVSELTCRLLQGYAVRVVPDMLRLRVSGHAANVKCVDFVGDQESIVSGSR